eukprot:3685636-Pyramimonas_sp.AAC.1
METEEEEEEQDHLQQQRQHKRGDASDPNQLRSIFTHGDMTKMYGTFNAARKKDSKAQEAFEAAEKGAPGTNQASKQQLFGAWLKEPH